VRQENGWHAAQHREELPGKSSTTDLPAAALCLTYRVVRQMLVSMFVMP